MAIFCLANSHESICICLNSFFKRSDIEPFIKRLFRHAHGKSESERRELFSRLFFTLQVRE